MTNSVFRNAALSLTVLICASNAHADEMAMPDGFDKFVWAELQKLTPEDREIIFSFDSIGDGTGSLPILPVARLGPDGLEGTDDDLAPREWVRLGGFLRNAQGEAARARGEAALAEGQAALAIGRAMLRAACYDEGQLSEPVSADCQEFHDNQSQ